MKKIIGILAALAMCFTLTSCVTTAQAQIDNVYDDVEVSASVVIAHGNPVFDELNRVLYYIYDGWYYYPYVYGDGYVFYRYRHLLPRAYYYDRFRPLPRDFHRHVPYSNRRSYHMTRPPRHNNGHHMTPPSNHGSVHRHSTPHMNNGHSNMQRPHNSGMNRPQQPRSSTRTIQGPRGNSNHGRMGGRR